MKTNLKVSGTLEFSEADLVQAIKDLAKSRQGKEVVVNAIDSFLALRYPNVKSKRVQYTEQLDRVLVEVDHRGDDPKLAMIGTKAPARERIASTGHVKKYKGFFGDSKDIIKDYRKKGVKEIPFDQFYEDISFFHQGIEIQRVKTYLLDKRQLKGITYDSKNNVIKI